LRIYFKECIFVESGQILIEKALDTINNVTYIAK